MNKPIILIIRSGLCGFNIDVTGGGLIVFKVESPVTYEDIRKSEDIISRVSIPGKKQKVHVLIKGRIRACG
ncbi:MAG: hypothetical protein ACYDH1_17075 [Anaerolineaceae bacterium]